MMKNIVYFDPVWKLQGKSIAYQEYSKAKASLEMKYFPKYLKSLSSLTKNGPARSKVKRMKIIREFQVGYPFYNRADWRVLLANKMKSVKTFDSNHQSSFQSFQKIKLLSGLQSAQFYMSKAVPEACEMLQRLTKLKCLEFFGPSRDDKALLEVLNSLPRLLRSLESLILHGSWKGGSESEVLEMLYSKKTLLKHVTCLYLRELCSPAQHRTFQNLANLCPNLKSLSFEFSNRDIFYNPIKARRFLTKCFPVETNYLSTIETFQNLRSLNLKIADTMTFLTDFGPPPPLLQHLTLNFEENLSKKIMLSFDNTLTSIAESEPQILQVLQKHPTFLRFYQNFLHLERLETLDIRFSSDCDQQSYKYQSYLSQYLLQKLATLKKLAYLSAHRCWGLNEGFWSVIESDIPQLLESCLHLGQTLQTLEIGHDKIIFSDFDLSLCRNRFQNLSTVKVIGRFDEEEKNGTDFVNMRLFLEQIISLGDSIKTIQLTSLIQNTVQSLLNMLKELNKLELPSQIQLELQIKLINASGSSNLEDLEEGFESVIEGLKESNQENKRLQGVSLRLQTDVDSDQIRKFLEAYGEKFQRYQTLPRYSQEF